MLELDEARERVLAAIQPLPVERVRLSLALGRCLGEEIVSNLDLPVFDNSAMDGYAVRAGDVHSARVDAPVSLRLAGRVAAGDTFEGVITPGACLRIFTGSPMPAGADAVVMQEDTRLDPIFSDRVQCLEAVKPWENVRLRGEDVKAGRPLLGAGERINAGRIGLLAAIGVGEVTVGKRPVAALLSTGDELAEAGSPLRPGQIFESNRALLASLAEHSNAVPKVFPIVPDTLAATRGALAQALAHSDVVVTTGGVSVGEMDLVKQAFTELGGAIQFWKVAIKPGKPFVFGQSAGKVLFGLPGNPVSAAVTFLLLVRPALWKCQGATDVLPETGSCLLAEALRNPGDRRHFVRVRVDSRGEARSAGAQASHMLSSLASANGLVDVPAGTTLPAGSLVPVIRFGS